MKMHSSFWLFTLAGVLLSGCEGPVPSDSFVGAGTSFVSIGGPSEVRCTALTSSSTIAWVGTDLGLFVREGDTWAPVTDAPFSFRPVLAVEAAGGQVFVAAGDAVYRARDGGAWERTDGSPPQLQHALFASSGTRWVAAFDHELYDWQEDTHRWVRAATPTDTTFSFAGVDVAAFDGEQLHVSEARSAGVFVRSPAGVWSHVDTLGAWGYSSLAFGGGLALATDWDAIFSRNTAGVWTQLAHTPSPIVGLRIGTRALFANNGSTHVRSLDGGVSWGPLPLAANDVLQPVTLIGNDVLAISTDAVASSVDDGAHFTATHLPAARLESLALLGASTAPALVTNTASRGYTSVGDKPFTALGSRAIPLGDQLFLFNGASLVAPDGPRTLPNDLTENATPAVLGDGRDTLYATSLGGASCGGWAPRSRGLYRSRDGGTTWEDASRGLDVLPPSCPNGPVLPQIARIVALDNDEVFVFSTEAGTFRSTDGGTTWRALPGQDEAARAPLTTMARTRGTLWGASAAGLYRSDDDGTTWSRVPTFIDQVIGDVQGLGNLLFVSVNQSGGGVWVSSDFGTTFARLDDRLRLPVGALALTGRAVYAAVATVGVYAAPMPTR